jgi:hypothetical protein
MQQLLLLIGVTLFGILGTLHLIYTFFGNKFEARDAKVTVSMQQTSPVISSQTTIWRAWKGFNASHSLGAMLLPSVYIPLAINHMNIIVQSWWLSSLPILVGACYMLLAKRYWFNIPLIGISISTICFIGSALMGMSPLHRIF